MNVKKWMHCGVALVFISLAGNFFVFSANQLPAPVFAKHFYELEVYGDTMQVDLHYFTNRNDPADVMGVSIPDTDIMLPATVHDMGLEGTYRHQVMALELDERVMNGAKNINQPEADFANGKRMLADVGEINLFPYSESPLSGISSGASSDNTGYHL